MMNLVGINTVDSAIPKPAVILSSPLIIGHSEIQFIMNDWINETDIVATKDSLHIAYAHTSHGSQLIEGMNYMDDFKEVKGGTDGLYDMTTWSAEEGALDLRDGFAPDDVGYSGWDDHTRDYLDEYDNNEINVVMWSWCGQVSGLDESGMQDYLDRMTALESEYPDVYFVYMTGHLDGSGEDGNLNIKNNQMRDYCKDNNKILFDFADIESYDPSGNYYGDQYATDGCVYDLNGNGYSEHSSETEPINDDANWALDWQASHTEDVDWYDCDPAHTAPLNGNMKAYASWFMFVMIAAIQENRTITTTNGITIDPISGTIIVDPNVDLNPYTENSSSSNSGTDGDGFEIPSYNIETFLFFTGLASVIIIRKKKRISTNL